MSHRDFASKVKKVIHVYLVIRSDHSLYVLLTFLYLHVKYKGSTPNKIWRIIYLGSHYRASRATRIWALFQKPFPCFRPECFTSKACMSVSQDLIVVCLPESPIGGWCKVLKLSLTVSSPAKSSRETCCLRTLKVKDRGLICTAETIYFTIQLRSWYTISHRCLLSITDGQK